MNISENEYRNFRDDEIKSGLERILDQAVKGFFQEYGLSKTIVKSNHPYQELLRDAFIFTAKYDKEKAFDYLSSNFYLTDLDKDYKILNSLIDSNNVKYIDNIIKHFKEEDQDYLKNMTADIFKTIKEKMPNLLELFDKFEINEKKSFSSVDLNNAIIKQVSSLSDFVVDDRYLMNDGKGNDKEVILSSINRGVYFGDDYFFQQVNYDVNFLGGREIFPLPASLVLNDKMNFRKIELPEVEHEINFR